MSEYRGPQYLDEDKDAPTQRIRCPIHGFIRYSENERVVIDHWLFRRLRFIRQLALTEFVYPGATHSRFEHSLGVMEVATRSFDSLAARHGATIEGRFGEIPDFKDGPLAKARQAIRLAGLLHDIGHAPFSHAAEDVFQKTLGHEGLTIRVILNDGVDGLKEILGRHFWNGCAETVAKIITKGLPPQLRILSDIISGEMDADRTDYLLRDSWHCGVEYGRFDYRRMIECLGIWETADIGMEMAIERAGIHTLEALILARYQMNTQVYYHRVRRIYDHYLREYVKSLGKTAFDSPDKVLRENDVTMLNSMFMAAESGEKESQEWAQRIVKRNHHRVVHDTGAGAKATEIRKSHRLLDHLEHRFADEDFIHDLCREREEVSIHKIQRPDDPFDAKWIEMKVLANGRPVGNVGTESLVFRSIPHGFNIARIFADTGSMASKRHRQIEQEAADWWRNE